MKLKDPFKWRHFKKEIILLNVRWYLRYPLSYRHLEEMMLDRNLKVDHTTIFHWVQAYSPEMVDACEVWQVKYLNNIVEQDHRFIKRLVRPGLGFKSFHTAWRTLRGFEAMNMIRKGQIEGIATEPEILPVLVFSNTSWQFLPIGCSYSSSSSIDLYPYVLQNQAS